MRQRVSSKIMPYKDLSLLRVQTARLLSGHRSWYEEEKQEEWGTGSSHSSVDRGAAWKIWMLLRPYV